jgi:hypothetical protein
MSGHRVDNKASNSIDQDELLRRVKAEFKKLQTSLPSTVRVDGPHIHQRSEGEAAEVECWFWMETEPAEIIEILFRNRGVDMCSEDDVVLDFRSQLANAVNHLNER